jgi:hypothetical protein
VEILGSGLFLLLQVLCMAAVFLRRLSIGVKPSPLFAVAVTPCVSAASVVDLSLPSPLLWVLLIAVGNLVVLE